MVDIFVARQPISDRKIGLFGYELLYRTGVEPTANVENGEVATATVATNTIVEFGLDKLVGKHRAFLNLTRAFFVEGHYRALPADRVVLEVLENIEPDEEFIRAVRKARQDGFSIALDDFSYRDELEPLVQLAHFIKVDAQAMDRDEVRRHATFLRRRDTRLIAEKIETYDEYKFCRDAGYDYFQGYFFCRPAVIQQKTIRADRLSLVQLLARVQDPDTDLLELEELVVQNVTLSYKLLRYVNSALHARPREIESIHQAVVVLGLDRVRMCITLLLLVAIDDKPSQLMTVALVRARLCQLLARLNNSDSEPAYFTVGLLSVLDALLDCSMGEGLRELPLSDELQDALLRHEGSAGQALESTFACELGDWEGLMKSGFDAPTLQQAYVEAISWASEVQDSISGISGPD